MNSEKVKEIKKVLEQNTKTCLLYDFENNTECKVFQCKYILDYINELESENELLRNAKVVYENVDYCYEDLKKAEKRIAELEKENGELKGNIAYQEKCKEQLVNACDKCNSKIEQFAERLKEKYGKSCSEYYPLLLELTSEQLDETLKEFIK